MWVWLKNHHYWGKYSAERHLPLSLKKNTIRHGSHHKSIFQCGNGDFRLPTKITNAVGMTQLIAAYSKELPNFRKKVKVLITNDSDKKNFYIGKKCN